MGLCSIKRKKRRNPTLNSGVIKQSKQFLQHIEMSVKKPPSRDLPTFTRKLKNRDQFLATTTTKPISTWLLWHMYVTQQCFNDEVFRTHTINKVFAPLAFLTHAVMLWHFSDGITKKFFTKLLRVEGFYSINSFTEVTSDFQLYASKFIFNEVTHDNMVTMCNKIFISDQLMPKNEFKIWTKAPVNIQVLTVKSSKSIENNHFNEQVLAELHKICGNKFDVSHPEKFIQGDTKMISIVGTCVRVAFDCKTFKFQNATFLCHYGRRQQNHPFFIVVGLFSHAVFLGFEAWSIPLIERKSSSNFDGLNKTTGFSTNLALILVRPESLGDIIELEHIDNFDKIAKAIQILRHRKPKRGSLLLPFIDLPHYSNQDITYGVTDLTVNWRARFTPTVVSNMSTAIETRTTVPPGLDKFFHCASIRIDSSGITYQGSSDSMAKESNLLDLKFKNSLRLKPLQLKSKIEEMSASTKSMHIAKLAPKNTTLPEALAKKMNQEKLHHFNARFDSPFLFYVVDLQRSGVLLSGCYGGRPALSASEIRTPANKTQLKNVTNAKKVKTNNYCGVC